MNLDGWRPEAPSPTLKDLLGQLEAMERGLEKRVQGSVSALRWGWAKALLLRPTRVREQVVWVSLCTPERLNKQTPPPRPTRTSWEDASSGRTQRHIVRGIYFYYLFNFSVYLKFYNNKTLGANKM